MPTILAIESSCDDTGVAILSDGQLISNQLASQVRLHKQYGGVVPEVASRAHCETINPLIDRALNEANITLADLTHIAVTVGPGLEGALLVGISAAKSLGATLDIPVIGVNHLQGHIYSAFLSNSTLTFPFIVLLASGGHTILAHAQDHFDVEILGQTRDDAIGEAFDKVARLLGLGYPGGPVIDRLAQTGNSQAFSFPKALHKQGYDFSFSGLKSAVYRQLQEIDGEIPVADIAASFQKAACDSLIDKSRLACEAYKCDTLVICGGVSANSYLRNSLDAVTTELAYCTDNAAMIGMAGHYMLETGASLPVRVQPNLAL